MIVSKLNTQYTNNQKSAPADTTPITKDWKSAPADNTPYTQNRKSATADTISQSAVSQHLKILKSAGLVEDHKQGYFVHYKIMTDSLHEFGIDMISFLKSFGAEMNENNYCIVKGDSENCTRVNSTRVNS
ncbi:MAG: helix-turn-helix transcriptional regulator [Spirochaetales bacterium]|nr:helix-turn-helix transcriptional regulator [Spirochaetales bacterium]